MADRIFAGVLLIVTLAYGAIAFTVISAPFQYDPLGPESWPRILAVVAFLCGLGILFRPDVQGLGVAKPTWVRLVAMLVLLLAYAELYEPLGFIASTFLFAAVVSVMLGARIHHAAFFGVAAGGLGYLLCVVLLELNLPEPAILEMEWAQSDSVDDDAAPDTPTDTTTDEGGTD